MRIKLKNHNANLYQAGPVPAGAAIIGEIVDKGPGNSGALALLQSGQFVRMNAGVLKRLEQQAVYTALVKALIQDLAGNQAEFAERTGFSTATVSSWSSGRRVPNFGTVKLLLLAGGVLDA